MQLDSFGQGVNIVRSSILRSVFCDHSMCGGF